MPRYAVVDSTDTIVGFRNFRHVLEESKYNTRETAAVNGNVFLLLVEETQPSFDPITEELTGPVHTVFIDKVTSVWTMVALDAAAIQINQDNQAAGAISGRLGGRELFATTTLMEAVKEMYQELRTLDPGWDLTPETKRKAQKLIDATTP